MHPNKKYLLILAVIAISGASNCICLYGESDPIAEMSKLAEQQKIQVNPDPLELHGDSITFAITIELPVKMMKKRYSYTQDFFYKPGDFKKMVIGRKPKVPGYKVGSIHFQDDKYADGLIEPIIKKKMTLAYKKDYAIGFLYWYGHVKKLNSKRQRRFGPVPLRINYEHMVGTITTSRLVKKSNEATDGKNGVKAYQAIRLATSRTDGKYKMAYELLKNAPKTATNQFNQGLAYLLEGKNYKAAKTTFESLMGLNKEENAMTHYMLAIVAARTKQTDGLLVNLKKAIVLKKDLKRKAREDREFFKFNKNPQFLEVVR